MGLCIEISRCVYALGNLFHAIMFLLCFVYPQKPENILLSGESDVGIVITDFGLAKRDATCKTFCGTPQYFAPEVLERQNTIAGFGEYGKAADIWSAGVVAYVVLSGAPAFPGDRLEDAISMGAFSPMTGRRWHDVSPQAKDFVQSLLVVQTEARPTAAIAAKHQWIDGQCSNIESGPKRKNCEGMTAPAKKRG